LRPHISKFSQQILEHKCSWIQPADFCHGLPAEILQRRKKTAEKLKGYVLADL
jgi:hypothetical protein